MDEELLKNATGLMSVKGEPIDVHDKNLDSSMPKKQRTDNGYNDSNLKYEPRTP